MKIRMRKKGFCFALCLFLFFLPVFSGFGQDYSFIKLGWGLGLGPFIKPTKIIIAPSGNVWMVNNYIAKLLDQEEDKWMIKLKGTRFYDMVFDSKGNYYAGSDTCIYFSVNEGWDWGVLPTPKFNRIYEMFWSGDSVLWVADSSRVWRLRLQNYQWEAVLEVEGKKSFATTPEGIYLGVKGKGLYFLPWSKSTAVPEIPWEHTDMVGIFPELELANNIEDIAYDPRDSTLWVVSYGINGYKNLADVYYYRNEWKRLSKDGFPSHPGDMEFFTTVAVDSNGAVWFGCHKYRLGLFKLNLNGSWDWFTDDEGLENERIFSITVDAQNRKWIAHPYGWVTLMTEYSTGVDNNSSDTPKNFVLFQNYPNPFNPSTEIIYELSKSGRIKISIYDINGRLVKKLADRYEIAGKRSVVWDGRNSAGRKVVSGIYICKVSLADGEAKSIKMILQK